MKDLVKQLAAKSGYDARYCSEYFDLEQFAESIVKECVDLFARDMTESILEDAPKHTARNRIKKHFGLE